MNYNTIKMIYIDVLINKYKIEYLGDDRYALSRGQYKKSRGWRMEYLNEYLHGKSIAWDENENRVWHREWYYGKLIEK